ncbi:MAG: mechanosensitive ion channel family protein [Bacteroidetes bacterium]|nr:mechanosensitive ion channel family protein [Bacteroidota bacterium]MBU1115564.1 mechanosensitive ion channel family protein [Bacteroidota bacterium]MBU1798608.1 mechanosensitive ion channel family protein [Bacteroidota bacterium]
MKKYILLILLLCGSLTIAQVKLLPTSDSLTIIDSSAKATEELPAVDSIISKQKMIEKPQSKDTSETIVSEVPNATPTKKADELFETDKILPQLNIPELTIFKTVNLFTFFEIFILILISIGLTKLIDFVSKLNNLKKRFIFFKFAFGSLKGIIWFIVVYIAFDSIMPNSKEFIFVLMLIVFIVFSVSLIPLIKNFIGGFYLTVSMPFSIGDFIKIADFEGEVEKINWKDIILISEGSNFVNIPNSLFLIHPVSNFRRQQKEQLVTLNFELPFHYDPEKIIKIIYEAALSSPYFYSKMKHKVLLINNDFIAQKRVYQLHVYIIDIKFTDNLVHSLNMIINRAISEDK